MADVSKVDRSLVENGEGWVVLCPRRQGKEKRILGYWMVTSTYAGMRRDCHRQYHAIWPKQPWKLAYSRGWRIVRVRLIVDPRSVKGAGTLVTYDELAAVDYEALAERLATQPMRGGIQPCRS